MCWSIEVSLATGFIEIIAAIFLYKRGNARDRWILPFALSITAMEFLEAILWYYIEPLEKLSSTSQNNRTCNTRNRIVTALAGLDLFFQPLAISLFGLNTTQSLYSKAKFEATTLLSAIVFVCSMGYSFFGHGWGILPSEAHSEYSSFGYETCSYHGAKGHILWKGAAPGVIGLALLPNQFSYFIMLFAPLVFFYQPRWLGLSIALLMGGLLGITFVWMRFSMEALSVFCWEGFVLYAFFLILPYIEGVIVTKEKI